MRKLIDLVQGTPDFFDSWPSKFLRFNRCMGGEYELGVAHVLASQPAAPVSFPSPPEQGRPGIQQRAEVSSSTADE